MPRATKTLLEMIEHAGKAGPFEEAWYVSVAHAALDYHFNNRRQMCQRTYRGLRHESRDAHRLVARLQGVFSQMGGRALDCVVEFVIHELDRVELIWARRQAS